MRRQCSRDTVVRNHWLGTRPKRRNPDECRLDG
jgi:hypothetical protein